MILLSSSNSSIKGYLNSWLYLMSFLFTIGHFLHVRNVEETYYFHFNSWLSFQRLCRLLREYNIMTVTIYACGSSVRLT